MYGGTGDRDADAIAMPQRAQLLQRLLGENISLRVTYSPQPLEPVFYIAFDQRIDPAAVLETIQVNAGSQRVSLRLADEADIQGDEQVEVRRDQDAAGGAGDGAGAFFRWRRAFADRTAHRLGVEFVARDASYGNL